MSSLACIAFKAYAAGADQDYPHTPSLALQGAYLATSDKPLANSNRPLASTTKSLAGKSISPQHQANNSKRDATRSLDTQSQSNTPQETSNTGTQAIEPKDSVQHQLEVLADTLATPKRTSNGCKRESEGDMWLDAFRANTHSRLCNTASWLDGLFGDSEEFLGQNFRGKVSVGFKQDEIDGLDPRLRVRIRTKLPNVSKRFNAFLGRVEEDSYISNTEVNQDRVSNVGLRSTNDEDSEWLVGLGYRAPNSESNGFDFSLGAKLSSGFNPYAKVAHRQFFPVSDNSYLHTTQTIFWREQDGYGVSSTTNYTRLIGKDNIWISQASVKYTEEEEQWEWFGETTWHHSISDKRGISSSLYMRGEEKNPVSLPEFGTTFTYIQPVLRDWLYLETGVDFRWEQYDAGGPYKSAVRFGIQFDMLLGDYYKRRSRHK